MLQIYKFMMQYIIGFSESKGVKVVWWLAPKNEIIHWIIKNHNFIW